jgi:eukaryotic-like serine/threonine-protein kinase
MSHGETRIEAVFLRALEIPSPQERAAYLQEACAGDDELRRRVERMLAAQPQLGSFLDQNAAEIVLTTHQSATERPGAQIGPYKLLQQIGEGGMGVVFMAEQSHPVQRKVALKVIRPGMDSRPVIARFEAERQALAMMDHVNIARVLDAGATESGRPYFVMELVQGVPITKYCDDNHLTPRQRLELFVPVCQAIQHAHQKGVIHRDVKPSNVLITLYDGKPVPKVIDFGVAKATEKRLTKRTLFTQYGALVGTLEYMSPEQAEMSALGVDTRSDIYSLGVLLYELLTGSTPLSHKTMKEAAYAEILRMIKEDEPPKPSTRLSDSGEALASISANRHTEPAKLTKLVRGELDWIVMKTLEKDRNRRYETANGLAMDVARYLADEPVLACPSSAGYRLWKYARKYKKLLAAAGAFAALLAAATVISIGLASWALRERSQAEKQKHAAELSFKKALEAVDQMLTRVGEAQLLHVPQMELVRRDLLQDALRFYREFLGERGDNPLVRSEAASAYRRVGQIQVLLGKRDEGEEAYRQAVALVEKLLGEFPDDAGFRKQLAGIHNDLGRLYLFNTERWPQAEAALQRAVALLEQLVSQHPTLVKNRLDLARSQDGLANLYRQMGRLDQAETAFLRATTLLDGLLTGDPRNVEYLTLLAGCQQNGGLVYGAQDRPADAEAACQKALAINQQLVRDYPEAVHHQKRLAQTLNNLGLFYARNRQDAKAEAAYQQSLALNESILRDHPKAVTYMVDVGGSYSNMASHVRNSRSPEESLEWSARAIRTLETVLKQDSRDMNARMYLFDAFLGRAFALVRLGRDEEAAKDWRQSIVLSAGRSHINMRLYRPPALARLGEHVPATAEAETLLAEGKVQGSNLYTFAYVHSLSSAAAAIDARLAPAERAKLSDKYAGRSVELLRKAQATGYFQSTDRLARMKENKDLDAIRSRADFQALLVELEKKR